MVCILLVALLSKRSLGIFEIVSLIFREGPLSGLKQFLQLKVL